MCHMVLGLSLTSRKKHSMAPRSYSLVAIRVHVCWWVRFCSHFLWLLRVLEYTIFFLCILMWHTYVCICPIILRTNASLVLAVQTGRFTLKISILRSSLQPWAEDVLLLPAPDGSGSEAPTTCQEWLPVSLPPAVQRWTRRLLPPSCPKQPPYRTECCGMVSDSSIISSIIHSSSINIVSALDQIHSPMEEREHCPKRMK